VEHNPDSGILPRMDGATTPPPGHDAATVLEDAGATAWTSAGMTDLHGDISRMFAHPSEAGHLLLAASVGSIVAVDWDNGTQVDASDTVMTDDDEWQGGGFTSDGAEHVLATKNGGLVLLTRPAGGQWQWTTLQGSFYGITVGAGAGGKPLVYAPEGVTDYSSVTAPVFDSAPGGGLTPPEMISWAWQVPSGQVLVQATWPASSTPTVEACALGQPLSCPGSSIGSLPSQALVSQARAPLTVAHFALPTFVIAASAESLSYSTDGGQTFDTLALPAMAGTIVDATFAPTGALRVVILTEDSQSVNHLYSMHFTSGSPSGTWEELGGTPANMYAVAIDVAGTLFVAGVTELLSTTAF